jgi:ABC-type lipoprotein export system ATPase subunit
MDERTSSTDPALHDERDIRDVPNWVPGAGISCLVLAGGLMAALFGASFWAWLSIAALTVAISAAVFAGRRLLRSPVFLEDYFQKWQRPAPVAPAGVGRYLPPGTVLALSNVRKSYKSANGEVTEVLKGLDLSIQAGSFNVIRGESGSGKTSLLRILGMLDSNFEGNYLFAGHDVKAAPDWRRDELRASNIGFIFQDGQLLAHMKIRDNITLPIRLQGTAEERANALQRIASLAPEFFTAKELSNDILSNRPTRVSGGQKQRAAIMRSVVNKPALILADEPTASLDESRKQEVLDLLLSLSRAGHTVIIVSHDKVFYQTGWQLELKNGTLHEVASGGGMPESQFVFRRPAPGRDILYGWRPRAPLGILIGQALRETFLRPIFLFLVLVSLCVGVCQIGVFSSLIVGAQAFLDDAMTRGSRLNRLEIKPRMADLDKIERFPVTKEIQASAGIQAIVPRRSAIARVYGADGQKNIYSTLGLQTGDPEYRLLTFVAGGPFTASNEELEVIVTAALLSDLFTDAAGLADGTQHYTDFIGRPVTIEVPQFSRTGQELEARARKIQLKIAGIILYAEGGRQLYLPNRTLLVFDRYKMDREGTLAIPTNEAGDAWLPDRAAIADLVAFPWEDQLHVYTKQIRDIIPVFKLLSELGYRPASDIWNYKWVLDVRDLAWNIFIPLLGLIILAVALTVATNLFTSAKLRETEFALWRILGMRRGDLVITQIVSTFLMVLVGAVLGLLLGSVLVDGARSFLTETSPDAGLEKVFAPVSQFYAMILVCSIVVGVAAAIYPALRTARADPAKVLQS